MTDKPVFTEEDFRRCSVYLFKNDAAGEDIAKILHRQVAEIANAKIAPLLAERDKLREALELLNHEMGMELYVSLVREGLGLPPAEQRVQELGKENQKLREALEAITKELGVPQPGYPRACR